MNGDFDFGVVRRQIIKAYRLSDLNSSRTWSLETVMGIFEYFYDKYEAVFGVGHPHLRTETILTIINSLPSCDDLDFEPDFYQDMIDNYFEQTFVRCNYSMPHFMSGDVRLYRAYEAM